ncbi:hypothetical protein [Nitratifractor sp.]
MKKFKIKLLKLAKVINFISCNLNLIGLFKHKVLNIYDSGTNFTLELEKSFLKIPNPKRQKEIKKKWALNYLVEFNSFDEMKRKFVLFNKKKAHIVKRNKLIMQKIDARPLSCYINSQDFLNLLNKAFSKLKSSDLDHGDFHIDNILVDGRKELFFIDFDFKYRERSGYEFEYDLLKCIFHLKKYYFESYKNYKCQIMKTALKYTDKQRLYKAKENMQFYLQGSLDEFFN